MLNNENLIIKLECSGTFDHLVDFKFYDYVSILSRNNYNYTFELTFYELPNVLNESFRERN